MDVTAKPERWALHRAGGVVALAFLMTLLTVCEPGSDSGAQEISPKGVAAGGLEPVSKSQKQLRDWVAAGIQGGFIKPELLSIDETRDEMIWDFRSSFDYPSAIQHQIHVESIRLSPAPAGRRALWEPYLQRMERLIADQLQYGMDQYDLNSVYSQIFNEILNEAMAATAKAAGKKPAKPPPVLQQAAWYEVVLTTATGEGLIFIAPKTGYVIAQRTGEAIPFMNVSPGARLNRTGAYVYKIRYPDGRETPLRFIDILRSDTYKLQ